MLPKKERLTAKDYKERPFKTIHGSFFVLFMRKNPNKSRYSVVVPKSVSKSAVTRNRMRRRIYSALKDVKKETNGTLYTIQIKNMTPAALPFPEMKKELADIFRSLQRS